MKLYEKILMGVGAMILLLTTIFVIVRWQQIPDTIPAHFNAAGEADATGPRATILLPVAVGWIIYITCSVTLFFPRLWNIPKGWALGPMKLMMLILDIFMALGMSYMAIIISVGSTLGVWFGPVFAGGIFAAIIVGMIFSYRGRAR